MPDESAFKHFLPKNFLGEFVRSLAFQMHSGSLNALTLKDQLYGFFLLHRGFILCSELCNSARGQGEVTLQRVVSPASDIGDRFGASEKGKKKCVTAFCGKGLISYSHSSCTASLLPSSNTSIPSVYFQHVNQLTTPAAGPAISFAVTYSCTSRQMSILCRED